MWCVCVCVFCPTRSSRADLRRRGNASGNVPLHRALKYSLRLNNGRCGDSQVPRVYFDYTSTPLPSYSHLRPGCHLRKAKDKWAGRRMTLVNYIYIRFFSLHPLVISMLFSSTIYAHLSRQRGVVVVVVVVFALKNRRNTGKDASRRWWHGVQTVVSWKWTNAKWVLFWLKKRRKLWWVFTETTMEDSVSFFYRPFSGCLY